jgi:hypothetical protein
MQRAIDKGAMMAQLDEEDQLRQEGLALLRADVERDKAQQEADDALAEQLNKVGTEGERPFKRFGVGAYESLVDLLTDRYKMAIDILYSAYDNFNAYRQQRVLKEVSDLADVGNAIKTGAGFGDMIHGTAARFYGVTPHIQKVYKVGGSSDILYDLEGLPRFL